MEYFPKTEIKHHEKSVNFNYKNWYNSIPENLKLDINDLKIENYSKFNYDTWFKKLNKKDKIKAEYSKILKNIEITERLTNYIEDSFFKKEFDGDLKKLEKELRDVVFKEFSEEDKKQNKKELSKNQINYFKQTIKKIIKRIKNINIFFEEVRSIDNKKDKINKVLDGSGIKKLEDNFSITFNGYCFIVKISERDAKTNLNGFLALHNLSKQNLNYIILRNDLKDKEEEIFVHELRHMIYSIQEEDSLSMEDVFSKFNNLENENDINQIYKDLEKLIFESSHDEVMAYMSGGYLERFKMDYGIWGYKTEQFAKGLNVFLSNPENEKFKYFISIKNKETIIYVDKICKKYFFLVEKLFFKYKEENLSMQEFESIVRNIQPKKYKRLCIFLGIDPDKFEEIYDPNWTK